MKIGRIETLQEKYGDGIINVSQLDWVQERVKVNNMQRYGVESTTQLKSVQDKMKETSWKNYGCESPMQSEIVREKQQQTFLKRYGVRFPMQLESFRVNFLKKVESKHYKIKEYELKTGLKINYQSQLELRFIKICENENIEIENGDSIEYFLGQKQKTYFIDFKIKIEGEYQLIEVKGKHKWFYKSIEDGSLDMKIMAAQVYSAANNYRPFKMIMDSQIKKNEILEPVLFDNMPLVNSALLAF